MNPALIIPARYQSSRLPGKPLTMISGKPMIQRTYERCALAIPPASIYIATDDQRIAELCDRNEIQVVMTSPDCLTGTDRVAQAARQLNADYVINVQGDEPLINPADIALLKQVAEKYPTEVLNGYTEIAEEEDFRSRGIPKVAVRPDGRLLYMSRAPIPNNKQDEFAHAFRQVCIYGFPRHLLQEFAAHSGKCPLEAVEDIEILRFLELGHDVRMIHMSNESIAVDYPADVVKVEAVINAKEDNAR